MPTNEELHKQLIQDLLIESNEGLDRFEQEMLLLERNEASPETPNIIFRVIHTIKGTAGCLGLTKIESVAHVGENLLSLLREGKLKVTPRLISTLLRYADALRSMMCSLETNGDEGPLDYADLVAELHDLQDSHSRMESEVPPPPKMPELPASAEPAAAQNWGLFDDEVQDPGLVKQPSDISPSASGLKAEGTPSFNAPPQQQKPSATIPVPTVAVGSDGPVKSSAADSAIRVQVEQLDKLMNLVGELVLARNQIVQYSAQTRENSMIAASQRLNIITTELQENVMKTRMQPIGNVWAKFPRIVRDLAGELAKQVQLVMEGEETELDRTIIEAIKDPLTHVIRNAIDHGIESPEARRSSGKPDQGLLVLRAFHEGGQVNIEIMDDGRGISVAKVKEKALQRGLIGNEQAARMTDREILNLVFLPGFSTAEKVTNVSGRGVGMDVVKTNIEKIGGSVELQSELNAGATVKIKIPLTLAIIPALIVTSAGERFAIPQVSLLELVRLEAEQERKGIEMLYGAPVYRLRGQLLPLAYLNKELEMENDSNSAASAKTEGKRLRSRFRDEDAVNIVILQADGRQFGLVVDEINDTEEIVVKPLGKQLKSIACFAGATIMGDGRVALILDVLGLAQRANVIHEVRDRASLEKSRTDSLSGERQTLLLFNLGDGGRMAIPLSMVARLEEFPVGRIERSGRQEVVQYRGQILPLIRVSDHVPTMAGAPSEAAELLQVVVYSEDGKSVGLVVGNINDIVEAAVTIQRDAAAHGILGSAVIQERVTDLLDVQAVIRSADPSFYERRSGVEMAA